MHILTASESDGAPGYVIPHSEEVLDSGPSTLSEYNILMPLTHSLFLMSTLNFLLEGPSLYNRGLAKVLCYVTGSAAIYLDIAKISTW